AFMEAFQRGSFDRSKGRLNQWLFGIAYRQILSIRDRRKDSAVSPDGATRFWADVPDRTVSDVWDAEWTRAVLQRCLERVRAEFAQPIYRAFELVVREGHLPEQIAEQLGMTRGAVYMAKHRVLKRMRELHEELERVS